MSRASSRESLRVELTGDAERRYSQDLLVALKAARLNAQYPKRSALSDYIQCMGSDTHGGLYPGLEVDTRSGMPTYKCWTRVSGDWSIAANSLADLPGREELVDKARLQPGSIHAKRLLKRDYYQRLLEYSIAPLSEMEVALKRVEPSSGLAHFHVVFDKLDSRGLFVRHSIDLSQQSSYWKKEMVKLDDEAASHTEELQSLIYTLTSWDAELTFARLQSIDGVDVERVVKGTVGPFFFSGMPSPAGLCEMLEQSDGFVASFSIDMAAVDLAQDRDNDPLDSLLADHYGEEARASYDEGRNRYGYRSLKDRKFVIPTSLESALTQFCREANTQNIFYTIT